MSINGIKAVYFDMGGVLMDVLPDYSRDTAIRVALSGPLVSDYLDSEFDLDDFIAFTSRNIEERSGRSDYLQEDSYRMDREDFERYLGKKVPFEVFREKFWRQIEYMTSCFVLNKDAPDTLAQIRDRGYLIGLISNVFHPAIVYKELFTKWGIIDYFKPLVFSSEFKFKKPHKAIFDYALSWHPDLLPCEVLFIGDTWSIDVVGAQEAGYRPVWLNKESDVTERDGTPVIKNLREIIKLVC